jgi:hypothetical protein
MAATLTGAAPLWLASANRTARLAIGPRIQERA